MWRRALSHPHAALFIALIGVLLALPTLRTGLIGDDFLFRELITGKAHQPHPGTFFGLYTFADGNAAHVQAMKDAGLFQWWAADHALMSFWRPLSELSHWADYHLWPESPALMHAHSLLWYAALVWLLSRLYRMLDQRPAQPGLSALIFAISPMHLFTVIWLAARNQLIAGCLIVLTLMAFHLWRQGRGLVFGLLSMVSMIIGLAAAEAGVAAMGYLLAYVLILEPARSHWRTRLMALLPFVLIIVTWRLYYNHLGYGSAGLGGYIDPGADPLRFAHAVMLRMPALLLAGLYGVSSSIFHLLPEGPQVVYACGAGVMIVLSIWVGHIRQIWVNPLARFFGLGALLALVPVCAAATNDRLLLNAEFGLSPLLAMLFTATWKSQASNSHGRLAIRSSTVIASVLMFVHLLLYPIVTMSMAIVTPSMTTAVMQLESLSLPDKRDDPEGKVILINPPKALFVGYYPTIRRYFGLHNPTSIQALTSGDQVVTLTVLTDRLIKLTGERGLGEAVSRDLRAQPLRVGDRIRAGNFVVTVEAVNEFGNATQASFEFDTPLHDAPWQFYNWRESGYEHFKLPPAGRSVTLPPVDISAAMKKRLKDML
ncbi:MAG: hypothetical protein HY836_08780 [Aquabacterium sp.]|uniref:hypothetical protein n=1 Tax=Aquabacterium sp. TaxID=1872578 RepID=UPI0025C18C2A|nr:hypothetical protein [Aquabacterium sp.]MBI5925678.1 hypothetical protein [Aquabacterium sp.]